MLTTTLPPMRPELAVCPNSECGASGRIGIHSHKQRRYICHACGNPFAQTSARPFLEKKLPLCTIPRGLALLGGGWPLPAVVSPFGLEERGVADWQRKGGQHARHIQEQLVCQGRVDVGQVQA